MHLNYWLLAVGENGHTDVVSMDETATSTDATTATTQTANDQTQSCPITAKKPMGNVILMVALMIVMFFFLLRGPRKQQKEAKKLRESLAKNDRVRTIGGIFGTIIDINDTEVTLKIDESNNTKIKVAIAAIAGKRN